ncbi:mycofactocin-coupled SDR family oxidoreductase [Pseudonocardia kujensis]|uniref:mycofactocin-coupled SDR family oxidoreductase n=1 Tax=Pseudonocardia kujensis TaxID=1128675 RepID=UPI001E5560B3|nr:mycofactocin-coupled SDR family oxidoreductase [Pseudonocardia kujensis]MCE0764571.1 mycofactocin-coupled SDR family oxidoreductase [Pseudonocardia kujensis]
MGRLDGKVAFITGAARGQGRSHAIRLAEEGADIVALDLCAEVETAPYAGSTPEDLAQTVKAVEQLDRRILARRGDVRDSDALNQLVADAVSEFGGIDIVVANAGIVGFDPLWEVTDEQWQEMLDINLTGVWKTAKAVIPSMLERGRGGSIILISSLAGLIAYPQLGHYNVAKHGVTGLMRSFSVELAPHNIRVNSVHPTSVDTPMMNNPAFHKVFVPDVETPTQEQVKDTLIYLNGLRIPWVDPIDISNAVLYLASDESRYVTGTTQLVDAGGIAPYKIRHS